MAMVKKSRWLWAAAVLVVAFAAIWVARGSGSDSPVQAATVATQSLGAESGWSKFQGILDQETTLGHPAWSEVFSVRIASKFVSPESKWTAPRSGDKVTLDATSVTEDIDKSTPLTMDAQSNGSVSPDGQIQLANHSYGPHGGVTMIMTATVVAAVSEDSGDGAPAP